MAPLCRVAHHNIPLCSILFDPSWVTRFDLTWIKLLSVPHKTIQLLENIMRKIFPLHKSLKSFDAKRGKFLHFMSIILPERSSVWRFWALIYYLTFMAPFPQTSPLHLNVDNVPSENQSAIEPSPSQTPLLTPATLQLTFILLSDKH